jgi:hypothetical protein
MNWMKSLGVSELLELVPEVEDDELEAAFPSAEARELMELIMQTSSAADQCPIHISDGVIWRSAEGARAFGECCACEESN